VTWLTFYAYNNNTLVIISSCENNQMIARYKRLKIARIISALFLFIYAMPLSADTQVAFNFYPVLGDVNSDSDFTINTFAPLPKRFSYFSFFNFGGVFHSGDARFQITEQNLRWQITEGSPLDLVVQDTIRKGANNDTIHVGVRWRLNNTSWLNDFFSTVNLIYSMHVFPVRFDQRDVGGWQLSHAYTMTFPYISDRLYFSGFLDHNIRESNIPGEKRDNIVSENQIGVRIFKKLYAVAEFRVNEYRRSNTTNFGLGLELKTAW
jgi:hypothetical protein